MKPLSFFCLWLAAVRLSLIGATTIANTGPVGKPQGGVATSYSNTGGSGDRTGVVTVTEQNTVFSFAGMNTIAFFVNGDTTSSSIASFRGGENTSGDSVTFDFGSSKVIDEAKFYQGTSVAHGTWKWQGSADNSSYTDVGSSFTLGGAATQTITTLNGNTTAYRYWRMTGVSGTYNGGPWIFEMEFKIN